MQLVFSFPKIEKLCTYNASRKPSARV